ncbi:MAG TPA: SAM-dependent methyltransferase, partial [Bacteroidales bacterium]|nr:SAM-dependent methyltransferase [Bacteroidales bacterium]
MGSVTKTSIFPSLISFKAHKPHPKSKETYFGYYKDDGFVKRKIQGRYDAFGKWEGIKEKWISNYINRKQEAGFSVNRVVS